MLGWTFALLNGVAQAGTDASFGAWSAKDTHKLRQAMFLQNHFLFRKLLDEAEDGFKSAPWESSRSTCGPDSVGRRAAKTIVCELVQKFTCSQAATRSPRRHRCGERWPAATRIACRPVRTYGLKHKLSERTNVLYNGRFVRSTGIVQPGRLADRAPSQIRDAPAVPATCRRGTLHPIFGASGPAAAA